MIIYGALEKRGFWKEEGFRQGRPRLREKEKKDKNASLGWSKDQTILEQRENARFLRLRSNKDRRSLIRDRGGRSSIAVIYYQLPLRGTNIIATVILWPVRPCVQVIRKKKKEVYWSFARAHEALRQRLRVVRDFVYRDDRGSHLARRTKTRNFSGISTGIMRPVERIMHPGIRDGKGMITRCCSFLPGVVESLRTGFTRQLVKQPMKFEFLPAALRPSLQVPGMQTLELMYHRPRVNTGILYKSLPSVF